MNIDEMPAGREMDALVAEKVMGGYESKTIGFIALPEGQSRLAAHADFDKVPHYSTDIAAAWEVVQRMWSVYGAVERLKHDWLVICELRISCSTHPLLAHCIMNNGVYPEGSELSEWVHGWAEEMPLAICRAALKAVL